MVQSADLDPATDGALASLLALHCTGLAYLNTEIMEHHFTLRRKRIHGVDIGLRIGRHLLQKALHLAYETCSTGNIDKIFTERSATYSHVAVGLPTQQCPSQVLKFRSFWLLGSSICHSLPNLGSLSLAAGSP